MVKSFTDSDLYTPKKRLGIEEKDKKPCKVSLHVFVVTPTGLKPVTFRTGI